MKILLSIHDRFDKNTGGPGVTWRLGCTLRERGNHVDFLSFDDMKVPHPIKRFSYPSFVTYEILRRPAYDVYDLSSGDGWILNSIQQYVKPKRSIFIARSHGLEHLAHHAILSKGDKLSWKYPLYNGGYRLWECKQSYVKSDAVFVLNQAEKDFVVQNLGVRPDKAYRIKNGIHSRFIECAKSLMNHNPDISAANNIAYVGRYYGLKGISLFHDVIIEILNNYPNTHLGFFGTGISKDIILKDYPDLFRSRISVVEQYQNEILPELLNDFGILVFPSLSEGLPGTVLESMACGLVPIGSNIPGVQDIINHGKNGLLFDLNHESMRTAIRQVLDDTELWQRLRKQSLSDVQEYSWQNVTDEIESIYKKLLSQLKA